MQTNQFQFEIDYARCKIICKHTYSQNRRIRSSYKERMVDDLALGAEEGRDKLR